MNHQPNTQPNLNVTPVGGEILPPPPDSNINAAQRPENLANPELTGSQTPVASLPIDNIVSNLPYDDNPAQPLPPPQNTQMLQTVVPIHPIERDLIGKEWILRAKQISAQSRDDPYRQSFEFSKLKAEYIKQRYNLTLKSP